MSVDRFVGRDHRGVTSLGRLTLLALCALAGLGFGFAVTKLPAPAAGPPQFWVGNMLLPWLLLPFVAGWLQRDPRWSVTTGIAVIAAAIVGFYGRLFGSAGFSPHDWLFGGSTFSGAGPAASLVSSAWQWLVLAAVGGAVMGGCGGRWARTRSLLAGIPIVLACLLEPLCWYAVLGYFPRPLELWLSEPVAALVLALFGLRRVRSRADRRPRTAVPDGAQAASRTRETTA